MPIVKRSADRLPVRQLCAVTGWLAALTTAGVVRAATYQFVDLTPAGSTSAVIWGAGGTQQVGWNNNQAMVWSGSAATATYLSSGAFLQTAAEATTGTKQGGYGTLPQSGFDHPLVWINGVPTDLSTDANSSECVSAFSAGKPAGYGSYTGSGGSHALLWTGQGNSFTDLNPDGYDNSQINAATDTYQAGFSRVAYTISDHAMIWFGTAASAVDLHPSNYSSSVITGVSATHQGGYAMPTGSQNTHAMIWTGSAASAIDLNPAGFDNSQINAVTDTIAVGFGSGAATGSNTVHNVWHALLWNGSDPSALDLHDLLPSDYVTSFANALDANGDIFGYATDNLGNSHAVEWQNVPEPFGIPLIGLAMLFTVRRRSAPERSWASTD